MFFYLKRRQFPAKDLRCFFFFFGADTLCMESCVVCEEAVCFCPSLPNNLFCSASCIHWQMFPVLGIYPVKGNRCERFKKKKKKQLLQETASTLAKTSLWKIYLFFWEVGGGGVKWLFAVVSVWIQPGCMPGANNNPWTLNNCYFIYEFVQVNICSSCISRPHCNLSKVPDQDGCLLRLSSSYPTTPMLKPKKKYS